MDFKEFQEKFDYPGSIVLLEGKRNVPDADQEKLTALGRLVTAKTRHVTFRSGNAKGADFFFSKGVAEVDKSRLHVVVPYKGHRSDMALTENIHSLDSINLLAEEAVIYQSKQHKGTAKLIDQYIGGNRNRYAIKSAYIIRDTVKVIGTQSLPAISLGIFYEDLGAPRQGGTGHTINVCERNGIPAIDQRTWFTWLTDGRTINNQVHE